MARGHTFSLNPAAMRKIVIAIVALLALAFLFFSLTELENVLSALQKSNPLFLLIALLLGTINLFNTSVLFGSLYRLVGLRESRAHMFLMATAANFVNMVAPSGGLGGLAVFLDEAHRRNAPIGRVTAAGVLYLLYEYVSLLFILMLGFIALFRRNNLNAGELVAGGFVLALTLTAGWLLFLGSKSSDKLGNALAKLARAVNSVAGLVFHRDILRTEAVSKFAQDIAEGISLLHTSGKKMVWPLFFTLNNKALLICILACTFLALDTPFAISTLVGGFSISYLFVYASPTPAGVGFVEGILPSALNSLGIPLAAAVLITLAFRGITLWFPFAAGAIAFRILQERPGTADG